MADFSQSDIDIAKKRVQEMRNKANSYNAESNPKPTTNQVNEDSQKQDNPLAQDSLFEDKSLIIIMALILILSKEGADNKLILALLYLLL